MSKKNKLQSALDARRAARRPVFNLIESNFHECGFIPDSPIFQESFEEYLARRRYSPDPRGLFEARKAIAGFYNSGGPVSASALQTDPDNIVLTASSSEAYSLLFDSFCEPGDNVLIPLPSYPLFEDLVSYSGLEARFYPLDESRAWEPDSEIIDLIADARTRFIILISPNNPCGSVISRNSLEQIARICSNRQIMIISDEVFSEFLYKPAPFVAVSSKSAEMQILPGGAIASYGESRIDLPRAAEFARHCPVFTINGISKMFASPDFKLSWIVTHWPQDPGNFPGIQDSIEILETRNDTYLNANSFSQFLLPHLFAEAAGFVRNMRNRLSIHRDRMIKIIPDFEKHGFRVTPPQGGIHSVLNLPRGFDDEDLALRLIDEIGIYVHPGYLYGLDEDSQSLVFSLLGSEDAWLPRFQEFANFLTLL